MSTSQLDPMALVGMKTSAIAPDLLMDSYPLDNEAANGLIGNHRPRAESALFDQFISRLPHGSDHTSPSFISSQFRRNADNQTWREVNGDWRHPQNATNFNDLGSRGETSWVDNDQMDVPLLNSNMDVHSNFGRELENWDHCHQRTSLSADQTQARNQLIAASALCLIFMIAEAVGGFFSNSLAVMTDAAHMLSDFTSFLVSLFAIWVSARPPSKKMSFGYYRAEVLGALGSVLIIWILTGILIYMAISRIVHQDYDIDADTMIIVSCIGVVMNIAMGLVLHGGLCKKLSLVHHGHSHGIGGHGHSHALSVTSGDSCAASNNHGHSHSHRNMNVRAALIHVIGDLVQSIGVLVAAIVIKFWPSFRLADPICTFLFSGLVLATTIGLIRDASHVLMEGVPRNIHYLELRRDLKSIDGVCNVHSLHVWSLTMDRNAIAVHLAVGAMTDAEKVLKSATKVLQNKYGVAHCTVQVERFNAATMELCPQCIALED